MIEKLRMDIIADGREFAVVIRNTQDGTIPLDEMIQMARIRLARAIPLYRTPGRGLENENEK